MTSLFNILRSAVPRYTEYYVGMEVEAEGVAPDTWEEIRMGSTSTDPRVRAVTRGQDWHITTDGSLRNNGVEFVSTPLWEWTDIRRACSKLGRAFEEGLCFPHMRAGTHVHVNIGHLTKDMLRQKLQGYLLLEPLLFQRVGGEREQNIYCTPLYRAANERAVWRQLLQSASRLDLDRHVRSSCKYSALYIGPLRTFGTMEFRHAPCWYGQQLEDWVRLVRRVVEWSPLAYTPEAVREGFADLEWVDWSAYEQTVEKFGIVEAVASLLPYTYKVSTWGRPASLVFPATRIPARPTRVLPELRPRPTTDVWRELDELIDAVPRPGIVEQLVLEEAAVVPIDDDDDDYEAAFEYREEDL